MRAASKSNVRTKRSRLTRDILIVNIPGLAQMNNLVRSIRRLSTEKSVLSPAQFALAHRIGIQTLEPTSIRTALQHPSLVKIEDPTPFTSLASDGGKMLKYFVDEYISNKFPNLPPTFKSIAKEMYTSPKNLAVIAKSFGLEYSLVEFEGLPHVQFPSMNQYLTKIKKAGLNSQDKTPSQVLTETFLALLGLIAKNSTVAARRFLDGFLFTASFDLNKLIRQKYPILELTRLLRSQGNTDPVFRLLHETGRTSSSSMYIVGVFAGEQSDQILAEGYGPSILIAEKRAAMEALRKQYLVQVHNPVRPSDTQDVSLEQIISKYS